MNTNETPNTNDSTPTTNNSVPTPDASASADSTPTTSYATNYSPADDQPTAQQPTIQQPTPPPTDQSTMPGAAPFAAGQPSPAAPASRRPWWIIGGSVVAGLALLGGGIAIGANALDRHDDDHARPYTVTVPQTDNSTDTSTDTGNGTGSAQGGNSAHRDDDRRDDDRRDNDIRDEDYLDDATRESVVAAAIAAAGGTGGFVTDLDVERDRASITYEVEVQRADRSQADVLLDEKLTVLHVEEDGFDN